MTDPDIKISASSRTPPYVSYKTFLTLLEDLKTNGIPPQFDRSGLPRFSGGTVAQLLMALRSLGLMKNNEPAPLLHALVKRLGTPEFEPTLKEILRVGYPFLENIDLMTATPSMFADAFKTTGAKEDVLKKCRRFYLQAAVAVGIPVGPRIAKGPKGAPRGQSTAAPSAPRRRAAPAPKKPVPPRPTGNGAAPHTEGTIQQQLIAKFPQFDPAWPDAIKTAWFDGFKKLMATADPKDSGGS
jgi:hypothetical protein